MARTGGGDDGLEAMAVDFVNIPNSEPKLRRGSNSSPHAGTSDDIAPDENFQFVETSHSVQVLSGLNSLRSSESFCDITLSVDGEQFLCHKVVLASFSSYFKAMFTGNMAESQQNKVAINGVEADMIHLLINYAYTSEIWINKNNVQSLLSAANLLEVLPVRDACCQFLERHMDETNCLGIHCFAETHACAELQNKTKLFVLDYFTDVSQQDEFLNLSSGKLIEFICNDDLRVDSEEIVFDAVMRWLEHDRIQHCPGQFSLPHVTDTKENIFTLIGWPFINNIH